MEDFDCLNDDGYGGAVWGGQFLYEDDGGVGSDSEDDPYREESTNDGDGDSESDIVSDGLDMSVADKQVYGALGVLEKPPSETRDLSCENGPDVSRVYASSPDSLETSDVPKSRDIGLSETTLPTQRMEEETRCTRDQRFPNGPANLIGRIKRRDPCTKTVSRQTGTQLRRKLLENVACAKSGSFESDSTQKRRKTVRGRGLKPRNLKTSDRWDSGGASMSQVTSKRTLAVALVKGTSDSGDVSRLVDSADDISADDITANLTTPSMENSIGRTKSHTLRSDSTSGGLMKSRRIADIVERNKSRRQSSVVGQGRLTPSKVKTSKRTMSVADMVYKSRKDHESDVSTTSSSVSVNARIAVRRDATVDGNNGSTRSDDTNRVRVNGNTDQHDNVIWILFEDSANTLRTIRERTNPRNREAREGEGGWISYIIGTNWASCMSVSKHAEVLDEDVENEFRWLHKMLNGEEDAVRNTSAGTAMKDFVKSHGFSDLKKDNSYLNPFETHVALVIGGRRYDMTTHGLIVSNLNASADLHRRLGKLRLCFRITTTPGVTERLYDRLNTSASRKVHTFPGMVLGTLSVVSNVSTGMATRVMNWARGYLRGYETLHEPRGASHMDESSDQPVEVYIKHHTCTSFTWHEMFRESILSEPNAPEGITWKAASSNWQTGYLYLTPSVLLSRLRNMRHVPTHARKDLGLANLVSIESLSTSAYEKYLHEYVR